MGRKMMSQIFYLIVIMIITVDDGPLAWEYCSEKDMCYEGDTHIMCGGGIDTDVKMWNALTMKPPIPLTMKVKNFFLYYHNYYRNEAAGGTLTGKGGAKFPMAAKLREVIWDNELEFLARDQMRFAVSAPAICVNTKRFKRVNQHWGIALFNAAYQGTMHHLNETLLTLWAQKDEIDDPVAFAEKLTDDMAGTNFANVVTDRVAKMGCAAAIGMNCSDPALTTDKFPQCLYTICNYDNGYWLDQPTYETSTTVGSKCSDFGGVGMSKTYPNLCENDGVTYPYEPVTEPPIIITHVGR